MQRFALSGDNVDARAILLGVLFALMWSSAFSSARIIVQEVPPLSALTVRFAISGLLGVGIALLLGQSWKLNPRQWLAVGLFGLCQNAIYLGANFLAMQWIEASLAAILASTMPLQVALLNRLIFRVQVSWIGAAGLIVGFAGVVIIVFDRLGPGYELLGVVMCVVASVALCFATLVARTASSQGNLLMVVGLQLLVGCVLVFVPAVIFETPQVRNWSWELVAAFSYQILVPGLAATWIWFTLVNRIGPMRAASFHFLNPFLGVAVAALILGESMGPMDLLGVAIVTVGIAVVQFSREHVLV